MSARHPAHPDPVVALAIRQARHRIANPQEIAHLPPQDRSTLFAMAWKVLKTAQGAPAVQRIHITTGGAA